MDSYLPIALSSSIYRFFDMIQSLEPCIEKTVSLVPAIVNEQSKPHRFLLSMIACYPIGLIMHLLPFGNVRHWWSMITGAIILQACWGINWIHTPITSLIVYGMLLWLPRNQIQVAVPVFLMSYLAVTHFEHQYRVTNPLGADIHFTCSQMILTQKLYMLAWNLHDGHLLQTKPTKKIKAGAIKAAKSCQQFAINEVPSLLEFLGYSFCFSTVLVGPSFEFSYYRSACDGSYFYYTDENGNRKQRGGAIPNNFLPTLIPLAQGIGMMLFNGLFDRVCSYRRIVKPWFFNLTFQQRFVYNWVTNFIQRLKVYFTWLISEGCNNIWYVGFDGYDEQGGSKGWSVAHGADIWQLETCDSIKVGTKAWNKKTSQWLLRYVYIRANHKLGVVYCVSAFWHGFYPSYYLLALMIWGMSKCERLGRKKISPYFSPKKWSLYGVTCMFFLHALGSYSTTAFFLRSFDLTMENWRSHYFWGHIACVVFYIVVSQLPTPAPKSKEAAQLPPLLCNGTYSEDSDVRCHDTNIETHKRVRKLS